MTLKFLRSLVAFALCAPALCWSTVYYVSPLGNDANAGTSPAAAFKTIAKINLLSLAAGDQVLLEGGKVFAGTVQIFSDDRGTAASPVIVSSYNGQRATISAGDGPGVDVYNTGGVEISNLKLTGNLLTSQRAGVSLYTDLAGDVKLNHVYVTDVEISGFQYGFSAQASTGVSGFKNVRILRADVHGNRMGGIISNGVWPTRPSSYSHEDFYVGYSKVYDNLGDPTYTSNHSGDGIVLGGIDRVTIEYCIAYGNGSKNANPGAGPGAIWVWDSNAAVIQFNAAYLNKTGLASAADGGGFDLDGGVTNSVMQYNYSYGNEGAGYLLAHFGYGVRWNTNNTVRYNISEDDGRRNNYAAIQLWSQDVGAHKGSRIYNNTVILRAPATGTAAALYLVSSTENTQVFNNIFSTAPNVYAVRSAAAQPGMTLQRDDYWTGTPGAAWFDWSGAFYTTVAAFSAATGNETSQLSVNPQFISAGNGVTIADITQMTTLLKGYKLADGSPLVNQGLDLLAAYGISPGARDFLGAAIPQNGAFDVGATEGAPASWTRCAVEGGTCALPAPALVRYGANGQFATLQASGSIACNNATFGDPIYGVAKACDYQASAAPAAPSIANPGFESSFGSWAPYGYAAISSAGSHGGALHAVIPTGQGGFEQDVPLVVGTAYTFSAYGRVDAAGQGGYVGMKFFAASGAVISQAAVAINSTAYTKVSASATVPAGTTRTVVWGWKGDASTLHVDDVSLTTP